MCLTTQIPFSSAEVTFAEVWGKSTTVNWARTQKAHAHLLHLTHSCFAKENASNSHGISSLRAICYLGTVNLEGPFPNLVKFGHPSS